MIMKWKELPKEVKKRMFKEQVRQGNKKSARPFKCEIDACKTDGGFNWRTTIEGYDFWKKILNEGDIKSFYLRYPKKKKIKSLKKGDIIKFKNVRGFTWNKVGKMDCFIGKLAVVKEIYKDRFTVQGVYTRDWEFDFEDIAEILPPLITTDMK